MHKISIFALMKQYLDQRNKVITMSEYDIVPRDEMFINIGFMIKKNMRVHHDVCKQGQTMNDFVSYSGSWPSPHDCVVSEIPIYDFIHHRQYKWFCRITSGNKNTYFTAFTRENTLIEL